MDQSEPGLLLEKVSDEKFAITETSTTRQLVAELGKTAPNIFTLEDPDTVNKLNILVSLTHEANRKLFTVQTQNGTWCIVSPCYKDVVDLHDQIQTIDTLKQQLGNRGVHDCLQIHRYAFACHVADETLEASNPSQEPTIYPRDGLHVVGVIDEKNLQKTLVFDLTSQSYVFSLKNSGKDPISKGLMIIESLGKTSATEKLYGTTWERTKPDIDPEYLEFLRAFFGTSQGN